MASVVAAHQPNQSPTPMTSRNRVPLGALANAGNAVSNAVHSAMSSAAATLVGTKRPRSGSISRYERENSHSQAPAVKKQTAEDPRQQQQPQLRTPVKARGDRGMPPRRTAHRVRTVDVDPFVVQPQIEDRETVEQRALAKAAEKAQQEGLEKIRAWQDHYRRVFPTFVFYFESVSPDVASKLQKQVQALGARVEPFFSNKVTHVITTKAIPPENIAVQAPTAEAASRSSRESTKNTSRTSALDRIGTFDGRTHSQKEFTFKANPTKKFTGSTKDTSAKIISFEESRDKTIQNMSRILLQAREWNMKIWALEKLQRMITAMNENNVSVAAPTRAEDAHQRQIAAGDAQLQRLLRQERLHGPSDRDPDAISRDMVYFQGPFIMVKDMKPTHRPIMVREYEPVKIKEEGAWPQFRSTAAGKCPFIEDPTHYRREKKEEERDQKKHVKERPIKDPKRTVQDKEAGFVERYARERHIKEEKRIVEDKEPIRRRAITEQQTQQPGERQGARGDMKPPPVPKGKLIPRDDVDVLNPLEDRLDNAAPREAQRAHTTAGITTVKTEFPDTEETFARAQPVHNSRLFTVPSVVPAKRVSNEMAFTSQNPAQSRYAHEPIASGMQPSNITSAIRSQGVSSFMDIPGAKTAYSKDVLELKRKATAMGERRGSFMPGRRMAGNTNLLGLLAAEEEEKENVMEPTQALVHESGRIFKDVPKLGKTSGLTTHQLVIKKEKEKEKARMKKEKMLKPGYCENCRSKFDDFDEHINSRRHRRFALNDDNFQELDGLLAQLERPLKGTLAV